MIPTQLTPEEVLRTYRVLNPWSIPFDDPRMLGVAGSCLLPGLLIDAGRPLESVNVTRLLAWSDGSLGLVFLCPDPARNEYAIQLAYGVGRRALELSVLDACSTQSASAAH